MQKPFAPLAKAYGLPNSTPEEGRLQGEDPGGMFQGSPLGSPWRSCARPTGGIKIHERMGQIGSRLAISDVGCGVAFLKAGPGQRLS